jgi:hypothetical protein
MKPDNANVMFTNCSRTSGVSYMLSTSGLIVFGSSGGTAHGSIKLVGYSVRQVQVLDMLCSLQMVENILKKSRDVSLADLIQKTCYMLSESSLTPSLLLT